MSHAQCEAAGPGRSWPGAGGRHPPAGARRRAADLLQEHPSCGRPASCQRWQLGGPNRRPPT
eukprot:5634212-Alexandrium_andersonii.AAC.1